MSAIAPTEITKSLRDNNKILNTTDQVNSGLQKANEQYNNWKQILSGALNDKQLVWGLAVIFCFYVFYSVFNTAIGNGQDEDDLTCQCPKFHRWFYKVIVFVCGVIWSVCFVSIAIYDTYAFISASRNPASNDSESTDGNQPVKRTTETSEKDLGKLDDILKLCEKHLWLEFYKAYSVGAGAYEKVRLPDIRSTVTVKKFTKDVNDDVNTKQDDDETDFGRKDLTETAAKQTFVFFYSFLVIVRLLAQLAVVPMLILQMLSTYAWICITEDYHCQNAVTRYQLGLYQAYITFGFYFALLIAILTTTMLRWFPHSKDARDVGAACYA